MEKILHLAGDRRTLWRVRTRTRGGVEGSSVEPTQTMIRVDVDARKAFTPLCSCLMQCAIFCYSYIVLRNC